MEHNHNHYNNQLRRGRVERGHMTATKVPADRSPTVMALYLLRYNVALQIAILAAGANFLLACFTFWFGENALYCAFGADCTIGTLTSFILIWRFASSKLEVAAEPRRPQQQQQQPPPPAAIDDGDSRPHSFLRSMESVIEETPQDHRRELWSEFWLGLIMILSGLFVVWRAVAELVHHSASDDDIHHLNDAMHPLYVLALICLGLNLILMSIKLLVWHHLGSKSMLIEGVNSFISVVFSGTTILSVQLNHSVPYLDESVSVLFGIGLLLYGLYNVNHTCRGTVLQLAHQRLRRRSYIVLV